MKANYATFERNISVGRLFVDHLFWNELIAMRVLLIMPCVTPFLKRCAFL